VVGRMIGGAGRATGPIIGLCHPTKTSRAPRASGFSIRRRRADRSRGCRPRLAPACGTNRTSDSRVHGVDSQARRPFQLALDLLVTSPRNLPRLLSAMFHESGCADDSGRAPFLRRLAPRRIHRRPASLWMANVGGETLMAESPGLGLDLRLPRREALNRHLTGLRRLPALRSREIPGRRRAACRNR